MRNPDSIVYLNGQFLPKVEAKLDLEDRGAMFADGVYEVTRYYAGKPFARAAPAHPASNHQICAPKKRAGMASNTDPLRVRRRPFGRPASETRNHYEH